MMFISGASFLVLGCLACGANSETPAASLEEQASQAIGDASETQPDEEEQLAADQGESLEAILPVVVTDLTGTEVTVDSIDRIIPLDGTVAEVVFALGLGERVVATDMSATFPAEADELPEIGYQRALSAETIASYAPTVLLATDIAGPPGVIEDLRRLGFPVVIVPNSSGPAGPPEKIRAVAAALGVSQIGSQLATQVEEEIAASTVVGVQRRPRVVSLYLRGASTQLVLGKSSATHWIIEAAGGESMAAVLDITGSESISAEGLMVAAPDVILVPSAGLDSVGGPSGLLQIGGLSQTPAGRNGAIVHFDDQWLLGNGPRVGALISELAKVIDQARESGDES